MTNFLRSRDQRRAQGATAARRPDADAGVPQGAPRADGRPEGQPRARVALPQRRVLRRREEARRDPPDGDARAARSRCSTRPTPASTSTRCEVVAGGVKELVGPEMGALVITHYQRMLDYIKPRLRPRLHRRPHRRRGRSGAGQEARDRRLRALRGGSRLMAQTETEIVRGIGSDYDDQVRLPRSRRANYFFKSGTGLSHELVERDLRDKDEPEWMREFRLKALDDFLARPMPTWGGDCRRDRLRRTSTTTSSRPRTRPKSWDDVPADIKDTFDKLGIPEAEKQVPRRRRRAVRVGGRLPQAPGRPDEEGRHLPRHRHGAARARGSVQAVLRDDHPARTTTSSRRSTRPSGRAARSSTCRRA